MVNNKFYKRLVLPIFAAVIILSGLLIFFDNTYADPPDEGPGNFCVDDLWTAQPAPSCTANDVRVRALYVTEVITPCGSPGGLTAYFDMVLETAPAERYDIGFFISTNISDAIYGDSCYHGYLHPVSTTVTYGDYFPDSIPDLYDQLPPPTFTGFIDIDGDACGDMEPTTQAIREVYLENVVCRDSDGDGVADINICSSWDNNQQTTCNSVREAYPGTSSKCGCTSVNLETPTGISLYSLDTKSSSSTGWLIPTIAAVLLAGSAVVILLTRKFTPQQT